MKICTKCHLAKNESEFFFKDKKRNKLHAQCKVCYKLHRAAYHIEHYRKYGNKYRARAKIRNARIKRELQDRLIDYLSTRPCAVCGENDLRVLDFDHLDPDEKSFNIARGVTQGMPWHTILGELRKCRVLCANCHRKHTAVQFNWYKARY